MLLPLLSLVLCKGLQADMCLALASNGTVQPVSECLQPGAFHGQVNGGNFRHGQAKVGTDAGSKEFIGQYTNMLWIVLLC